MATAKATDKIIYRRPKSPYTVIDVETRCKVEDEFSLWPPPVGYTWFCHAKTALSNFEKQQGAEFEIVGLHPYSCQSLVLIPEIDERVGDWIHISFIVVPKGTDADDVASCKLVFAEMVCYDSKNTRVTHCSILEPNDPEITYTCGICDPNDKIPHPSSSGYLMGHWTYGNGEIPDSAYENHWFKEEIVGSSKRRKLDLDKLFKGNVPRWTWRSPEYAEIALNLLHKKGENNGIEFEVVEGLAYSCRRGFFFIPGKSRDFGEWVHVSFTAKPKNVEDDSPPVLFFAELSDIRTTNEYNLSMCRNLQPNEPGITYSCGICNPEKKIAHAPNYLAGRWSYDEPCCTEF